MSLGLLILGLLLFVGLVVLHEFGHFLAARRSSVKVEEFGIGFPPKIWSRRAKSGYRFSVNLLPMGGFVRLKGEHDTDKTPGSFGAASLATKVKIMLAGVAMNLVAAFAIFTLLALIGMPKLFDDQFTVSSDSQIVQEVQNKNSVLVGQIASGSPADKAGLKLGDQIVSVNGIAVDKPDKLSKLTEQFKGQTVNLLIKRADQTITLTPTLNPSRIHNQGYLGVVAVSGEGGVELRRSTWSAPIVAAGLIKQFSFLTYKGLATAVGGLFRGDTKTASEQVSGPVGVFVILKEGSRLGVEFILMIIGLLSLTLALINILPIPALDGGRLFITLLFRSIKKPLSRRAEEWINGLGFAFLMLLFILITIVDVNRFR